MSSEQPQDVPPPNPEKQPEQPVSSGDADAPAQDAAAMDTTPDQPPEETWADIPDEVMSLSTDDILTRIRLIENDIKVSGQGCDLWRCLIRTRRLCGQKLCGCSTSRAR